MMKQQWKITMAIMALTLATFFGAARMTNAADTQIAASENATNRAMPLPKVDQQTALRKRVIHLVAFAPDRGLALVAYKDSTISLWNTSDGSMRFTAGQPNQHFAVRVRWMSGVPGDNQDRSGVLQLPDIGISAIGNNGDAGKKIS